MPEQVPGATPAATTTEGPWYNGKLDDQSVGWLQNRGVADKPVDQVALHAIAAAREAQSKLGIPADQIIRAPKDATDEAGWQALWTRLGVPSDPTKYDFAGIKAGEKDLEADTLDFVRSLSKELHLTPDGAKVLASQVAQRLAATDKAEADETTAALEEQKTALRSNWGANFDRNMQVARDAIAKLGVDPEVVVALEGTTGYAKTMEFFRKLGASVGEDTFVEGGNRPGQVGPATKEAAAEELAALKRDSAWTAKLLAGDREAGRLFQRLTAQASGLQPSEDGR